MTLNHQIVVQWDILHVIKEAKGFVDPLLYKETLESEKEKLYFLSRKNKLYNHVLQEKT